MAAAGLVVPDLLAHAAARYADRVCVTLEGRSLTFAQAADRAARVAGLLTARGVTDGARLAVLAGNELELTELRAGAQRAGAILVPLNYRLSSAELAAITAECTPELVVVGADLEQLAAGLNASQGRLTLGPGGSYEAALAGAEPLAPPRSLPADRLGMISYTSGTTGRPKGAMLSNWALHATLIACGQEIGARPDAVYAAAMPMFHVGSAVGFAFTYLGATCHQLRRFDPAAFLALLEREPITHTQLVPTMIHALLELAGERPPGNLDRVLYGAAPMPPELARRVHDAWGCELINAYGSTEIMMISTLSPAEQDLANAPELLASVGRCGIGTVARVVDEHGDELPPRAVGEVVATGPTAMSGYWRNPEETAATLVDGWVHTGDLGYRDASGFLYLVDRRDDKIVTGGENAYPTEVEDALRRHPAVADAAVVGIADEVWGEAVSALIVVRAGATLTAQEAIDHCRSLLTGYKVPKRVRFAQALPRSPTGKLLRREVRRRWAEQSSSPRPS